MSILINQSINQSILLSAIIYRLLTKPVTAHDKNKVQLHAHFIETVYFKKVSDSYNLLPVIVTQTQKSASA